MGWFSTKRSEPYFYYEGAEDKLPPKHYGYWSVRWGIQSAESVLKLLEEGPTTGIEIAGEFSLFERLQENLGLTEFHCFAHSIAIHLVYAFFVLRVPNELMSEISVGLMDGLHELRDSDHEPWHEGKIHRMCKTIMTYASLITENLDSPPKAGVINLKGSRAYQFMRKSLIADIGFSSLEELQFQAAIDDAPSAVMNVELKVAKLRFQPVG